jgi:hypothetical protein
MSLKMADLTLYLWEATLKNHYFSEAHYNILVMCAKRKGFENEKIHRIGLLTTKSEIFKYTKKWVIFAIFEIQ